MKTQPKKESKVSIYLPGLGVANIIEGQLICQWKINKEICKKQGVPRISVRYCTQQTTTNSTSKHPRYTSTPVRAHTVNIEPPTKSDILTTIKPLKNKRAPGPYNLNAEIFKAGPSLAAKILQPLFTLVWENQKIPDDWSERIVIKLPKKHQ